MEFLVDTADLEEIRFFHDTIQLTGVTTNPSILKKANVSDFYGHLKQIRAIIGEAALHVQTVQEDTEGMLQDAKKIAEVLGRDTYIKIPTTAEGLRAMKALKADGYKVTATAIYTKMQAFLAIEAGADYLAPYYNRMMNQNIDAEDAFASIATYIEVHDSEAKILGASFKNVDQVNKAIECGAQSVTVDPSILRTALGLPSISGAVRDFRADFESAFGAGATPSKL